MTEAPAPVLCCQRTLLGDLWGVPAELGGSEHLCPLPVAPTCCLWHTGSPPDPSASSLPGVTVRDSAGLKAPLTTQMKKMQMPGP